MNIKAIFLSVTIACSSILAYAQQTGPVISVSGEAIVSATPEIAIARIPLQAKDENYPACNDKLLNLYKNLSKALSKAGFDEKKITANRLNIADDYSYQNRERVKVGYVGNMSLELKMDMTAENMGRLTQVMSQEQFSFGYSLSFELSETQKKALEEEAITKAVAQAKKNAELIASAAEVYLSEILKIEYGMSTPNYGPLVARYDGMKVMQEDAVQEVDMNAKEIEIRKHVDIVWGLSYYLPPTQGK